MTDPGKRSVGRALRTIYDKLNLHFGDLHWWPAETPLEVAVGAILTQNTNWKNVERAIEGLKKGKLLTPGALLEIKEGQLARRIRPSGYYRVKAARLKAFIRFLFEEYGGDIGRMSREHSGVLREKLLRVKGIGEETADSILLYAAGKSVFVVDAYTRRIFERHGLIDARASYGDIQRLMTSRLPRDSSLYNQSHALLVNAGKDFCRKVPRC